MIGKLLGAAFGWLLLGAFGAVLGLFVGHLFDRGLARSSPRLSGAQLAEAQQAFFTATFGLLGCLAKADGRVSEAEIARAEDYMRQMGLGSDHRERAIALFRAGREPGFSVAATVETFVRSAGRFGNLRQLLLSYLIGMALADGRIDPAEQAILREVAAGLGISAGVFEALLRMISAQEQFRASAGRERRGRGPGAAPPRGDDIALAYQALGVERTASDADIKRAYRRLMSEYHPDKLIGQGVPEDMIKLATERSQEVQAAYDLIRRARAKAAA